MLKIAGKKEPSLLAQRVFENVQFLIVCEY